MEEHVIIKTNGKFWSTKTFFLYHGRSMGSTRLRYYLRRLVQSREDADNADKLYDTLFHISCHSRMSEEVAFEIIQELNIPPQFLMQAASVMIEMANMPIPLSKIKTLTVAYLLPVVTTWEGNVVLKTSRDGKPIQITQDHNN